MPESSTPTGVTYESLVQTANRTGIKPSWWYDWNRRGKIPREIALKMGKYLKFIPSKVDEWIAAGCPEQWPPVGEGTSNAGSK